MHDVSGVVTVKLWAGPRDGEAVYHCGDASPVAHADGAYVFAFAMGMTTHVYRWEAA